MPLVGTLSTMPVSDLLQWVGSAGATGVLTFQRNKVSKRLVFLEGRIIACSTTEPSELLGHFLVSRGIITEDTLRSALARQEQSGGHLGGILLDMQALTADDLTRSLSAKAEETIFSLFDLQEAGFRFENEDVSQEKVMFPIDLRVEDILLRGVQRIDEMRRIRTVFNDPGIVLRRTRRPPPKVITENSMARRIYESINGERTVAEILLHAHASEYLVTKFLYQLIRNDMVEIYETREVADPGPPPPPEPDAAAEPRPAAPVSTPAPSVPSRERSGAVGAAAVAAPPAVEPPSPTTLQADLEVAGNLMARGEFDAALEILNGTYRSHPGDEALGRLLAEAEACFLEKAYRHFMPAHKIPVLRKEPEAMTGEQISPEEYFLLSRIDGTWDVKSIIAVSPLREVDVVRTLKRMREKGFIELRDAPG